MRKSLTLEKIARITEGRLIGEATIKVKAIAPIDTAGEGDITFAVSKRYSEGVERTRASAIILPENWPYEVKRPAVFVKDPYLAMALVANEFLRRPFIPMGVMEGAHVMDDAFVPEEVSIYPGAFIDRKARIKRHVVIYPGVFIGEGSIIGEGTILYPNVTVYPGTVIGKRCLIHAGAVIGSDGFGFAQMDSHFVKIPQTGRVIIEDDCEIGANTTIDRATFGETVISRGTKIDNLCQIGHNCRIGQDSVIVSQVGIAGSTTLGKNCMLGGQVGIVGHIRLGDRVKVAAQSGVAQSLPDDAAVSGTPAMDHRQWLKVSSYLKRLPELFKEVKALKRVLSQKKEGD